MSGCGCGGCGCGGSGEQSGQAQADRAPAPQVVQPVSPTLSSATATGAPTSAGAPEGIVPGRKSGNLLGLRAAGTARAGSGGGCGCGGQGHCSGH